MDAWDSSAFGNDSANDWLAELLETSDIGMVVAAFDTVLGTGDEVVDLQDGEEAVAAAEVVACMAGKPGKVGDVVERVESWMDEYELEIDGALASKARRAVDRVYNEPSELREGWEEDGGVDEWRNALADLKDRLKQGDL